MKPIQSGSRSNRIMIVGEAPGATEIEKGFPLIGASGFEFDHWLSRIQWPRNQFFITNVCHERPPGNEIDKFFTGPKGAKALGLGRIGGRWPLPPVREGLEQLQRDIDEIEPRLIIAFGGIALWALTGLGEILKRRGSILAASGGPVDGHGYKLIPILHPAYALRERVYRTVCIADMARAKAESAFPEIREPQRDLTVPRTPAEAVDWFAATDNDCGQAHPLTADVENNITNGDLTCLGFASSPTRAICIPFTHRKVASDGDPSYWPLAAELELTTLCRNRLRSHPITFHNGIHDCQILARHWGIMPNVVDDTMVAQHILYPGMLGGKIDPVTGTVSKKGSSLSLSFCASLYCKFYCFWKSDGRDWDEEINSEEDYWRYNAVDCTYTYEVRNELLRRLEKDRLLSQYRTRMELYEPVFEMMFDGLNYNDAERHRYRVAVRAQIAQLQEWIEKAVGHPLNVGSSDAMKAFFYNDLQQQPILDRKTRKPTLNDKALETIGKRTPVLRPLIERIQAVRTLRNFDSNSLAVKLSTDGRLKSAFTIGYVETMRFSSNENAFGEGFNMQNVPRNSEE